MPVMPVHALELEVSSSTRIELNVQEFGRRPVLRGRLMDNVNQGVAGATVWLRVHRQGGSGAGRRGGAVLERGVQTDGLGYFQDPIMLQDGSYTVTASYDGGAQSFYQKGEAQQDFDVGLWPVTLGLEAPGLVNVDGPVKVAVRLKADVQTPRGLRLPDEALQVTLAGFPAQGTPAMPVATQALPPPSFETEFVFDVNELGGLGAEVWRVEFGGNDYVMPAQAEVRVRFCSKPTVELRGAVGEG